MRFTDHGRATLAAARAQMSADHQALIDSVGRARLIVALAALALITGVLLGSAG